MATTVIPERVKDIEVYEETAIVLADFTDGGGAAGTYQVGFTLPATFWIERAFLVDVTGFAGDTSAVVTIGDGSDADRLNTGTPSVFASADVVDLGVPSGTQLVGTAFKPTVTVTSGSDFGAVTAGQMTLLVMGYEFG